MGSSVAEEEAGREKKVKEMLAKKKQGSKLIFDDFWT